MFARNAKTSRAPRRRGTAEIELLLCCLILLTILALVRGGARIGMALISATHSAITSAFHDATATNNPVYANDATLQPLPGFNDLHSPELPNRLHVPRPRTPMTFLVGPGQRGPTITVGADAALLAPAWTYSAYPVSDDQPATADWFNAFAAESHTVLTDPFILAPSWPP